MEQTKIGPLSLLKSVDRFEDLVFEEDREMNGVRCRVSFGNGYGASIICHDFSYGGKNGKYELAVLKDGEFCYDTPITNDVIGWLEPNEVTDLIQKIKALPAAA